MIHGNEKPMLEEIDLVPVELIDGFERAATLPPPEGRPPAR
jgi:hypothetical protein